MAASACHRPRRPGYAGPPSSSSAGGRNTIPGGAVSAAIDAGVVAGSPSGPVPARWTAAVSGTWLGLGWVMLALCRDGRRQRQGHDVGLPGRPRSSSRSRCSSCAGGTPISSSPSSCVSPPMRCGASSTGRRPITHRSVILTASLVSLVALPWALLARRRVRKGTANLFTVALAVMTYAALVGIARNGPVQAAVDVFYLIGPLVTGLFVLKVSPDVSSCPDHPAMGPSGRTLGLGGYGLIQFLILRPGTRRGSSARPSAT